MIGRPSRFSGNSAVEAELGQVQPIHEHVDHANRVISVDVIVNTLRQKEALRPFPAFYVARHGMFSPPPNRRCAILAGLQALGYSFRYLFYAASRSSGRYEA